MVCVGKRFVGEVKMVGEGVSGGDGSVKICGFW